MTTDSELLRQYAVRGDEAAFAQVVRHHANLVYSVALRVARDAALAEDVTQIVFTKLARQARMLGGYPTLVGWLHTTTRNTAINAIRGEERRRAREQETLAMQNTETRSDVKWDQLRPILDEAVGELGERDRQAVLLRYFNGLSHQEVGAVLGLSENAANKLVERALEKLRGQFARRGVTVSAMLLGSILGAHSVGAAPAGLASSVTGMSLAGVSRAAGGSKLAGLIYMNTKTKIMLGLAAGLVVAVTFSGRWLAGSATEAGGKTDVGRVQVMNAPTGNFGSITSASSRSGSGATVLPPVVGPAAPVARARGVAVTATGREQALADLRSVIATGLQLLEAEDSAGFSRIMTPPKKQAKVGNAGNAGDAGIVVDPGDPPMSESAAAQNTPPLPAEVMA